MHLRYLLNRHLNAHLCIDEKQARNDHSNSLSGTEESAGEYRTFNNGARIFGEYLAKPMVQHVGTAMQRNVSSTNMDTDQMWILLIRGATYPRTLSTDTGVNWAARREEVARTDVSRQNPLTWWDMNNSLLFCDVRKEESMEKKWMQAND